MKAGVPHEGIKVIECISIFTTLLPEIAYAEWRGFQERLFQPFSFYIVFQIPGLPIRMFPFWELLMSSLRYHQLKYISYKYKHTEIISVGVEIALKGQFALTLHLF